MLFRSGGKVVNRFCGSSMDSVHQVSQAVLAGFKKFSDLQLESTQEDADTLHPIPESTTDVVVDFLGFESLHCVETFDLVTENYLIADRVFSDEIIFENRILTDYAESVGNRVLNVDDISEDFDDNARGLLLTGA